jgi:salicylate hydroxylase
MPVALASTHDHLTTWEACVACGGRGVLPCNEDNESRIASKRALMRYYDTLMRGPPPPSWPLQSTGGAPLVIVSGCGIAGAAVCLALQQRGIQVVCFERDTSIDQRPPGYGFTLQQGLSALGALGFADVTLGGTSASVHRSYTSDGQLLGEYGYGMNTHYATPQKNKKRSQRNIQVPRQHLRKSLVNRLLPHTVRWGTSVVRFSDLPNGVRAHLIDCSHVDGTVLLACDGIRSPIRRQKLDDACAPLRYLGVMVILGICTRAPTDAYRADVHQTSDGTTRLYSMPFDNSMTGSVMWQLSFRITEVDALALAQAGPDVLLAEAKSRCDHWHAPLGDMLTSTFSSSVTGYPAYDRDLPTIEQLRNGSTDTGTHVTLLGDALHLMSPFKGQGANQALLDAVACARALGDSTLGAALPYSLGTTVPDALARFEAASLQRAAIKVHASRTNADLLHSPVVLAPGNGPRAMIAAAAAAVLPLIKDKPPD